MAYFVAAGKAGYAVRWQVNGRWRMKTGFRKERDASRFSAKLPYGSRASVMPQASVKTTK